MAQVQTARFPMNGPLWDEEVVPALRKRLESESRTLAKRMSAVSLSSQDDHFVSMHTDPTSALTYTSGGDNQTSPFLQSNASVGARTRYDPSDPRTSLDRILAVKSRAQNGYTAAPIKNEAPSPEPLPTFPRSRTYSQPYLSDLPNGKRPKTNTSTHTNGTSKFPRSPDSRPTRIPQPASRSPPALSLSPSASNGGPIPNGYHQYTTPPQDQYYEQASPYSENSPHTPIAIPRNHVNNTPNMNVGLGLLNETPPFNPASASSSITPSHYAEHEDEARPRASVESEERPFEHWYRGEVSRNGGVGELRVGRRQEMLEIANYGHTLRARERERREDGKRRKRADSVSGITGNGDVGRARERESLFLDEEDARGIGRVLDEAPLTDFEESEGGHHEAAYGGYEDSQEGDDVFPRGRDMSNGSMSPPPPVPRSSHDVRSTTPTPTAIQQPQQRPSSRNAIVPPSRIPARSRQSSESRVTTPTPMIRGPSETPSTPSASTSKSVSPPPTRQRQPSKPATPAGRGTPKSRTAASKATKAKTLASKKELEAEAKRRSVAYYPSPGEDGDETMIDAIPEWTQPVPRRGNWDDVVLPVVARKNGLEEHYEKADGNPTPRKVDTTIAPAPGTFGFDHSKYRPPRGDGEPELIPMDEFGRPTPQTRHVSLSEDDELSNTLVSNPTSHDQTRLPVRTSPSPAPFSDYAPMRVGEKNALGAAMTGQGGQQQLQDEKDEGGGCCKCIIM
ncbi:hypothetical protein FPV67DRAFT_1559938 [Lyophyllum atratum]|nr:hypothetical protein FPV67DRAFT_1559938 [Lyophyllum atratum]